MKKLLLLITTFALTMIIASCSKGGDIGLLVDNDEKIADQTFNQIISAIKLKDNFKIAEMFSDTIKRQNDQSDIALSFINYIQGDIISYTCAAEKGVGADYKTENGTRRKEIQSSFCIKTTESVYYIAIKECTKDALDDRVGLISIYIINSKNWTEDYVYRGDGKWTQGINIVDSTWNGYPVSAETDPIDPK